MGGVCTKVLMDGMTEADVKRMRDLKTQRAQETGRTTLGGVELNKAATFAVGEGGKALKKSNVFTDQQKSYRQKKSKKDALAEERAELQAKMLIIGKGKDDMGKDSVKSGASQEKYVEGHGWTNANDVEDLKRRMKKDAKSEIKEWSKSFKEHKGNATRSKSSEGAVSKAGAKWLETTEKSRDSKDLVNSASRREAVKNSYSPDGTRKAMQRSKSHR